MKIPYTEIQKMRKFAEKLESIKYVHFRELYKRITHNNFQRCTRVDFKGIEIGEGHENIHEIFGKLKHEANVVEAFTSKSGSNYFTTKEGEVYRLSNHWGAVASCAWTREGKGELRMSVFINGKWEIGVANLKDFKIFRRKNDRKVDIIVNPKWKKEIQKVENIMKKLKTLKSNPKFKKLPVEDKKIIGQNFGWFNAQLKFAIT